MEYYQSHWIDIDEDRLAIPKSSIGKILKKELRKMVNG